ncbi:PREDICTED: uncharacterized protein LOC107163432, partial [Diuraphis noxia]|uniref:uncharacterized protein LOC107163432 n=1 Tax=Diuraphis noxia TaxID=143948 RepID=UPI00076376AD
PQDPSTATHTDPVPTQQEVNWPPNNIATPEVIVIREAASATLNTRGFNTEQTRDKPLETSSSKSEEISPKVIVNSTEQKGLDEIVTKNNAEIETKNLALTNNG